MANISLNSPIRNFEDLKQIDSEGIEFWLAQDLMRLLGYKTRPSFQRIVARAQTACRKSGQTVASHFVPLESDLKLSRYASYLIVQNADPSRPAVANAQTYFAIQARRQEVSYTDEDTKRLLIRQEVKHENKELFNAAAKAGVTDFGTFNRLGYLGLYNMTIDQVKDRKNIGDDDLLDRAGVTELAANLFRITQAEEKIKKDRIRGQGQASLTHMSVGRKVREVIADIGGTVPEDLPAQPHIRHLQKRVKSRRNLTKLLK